MPQATSEVRENVFLASAHWPARSSFTQGEIVGAQPLQKCLSINSPQEADMLIQSATLVLASQLLIAVADNLPEFNIERGCKETTSASGPKARLDETVCVRNEQKALGKLQSLWLQAASSNRAICIREATENSDVTPSYVELLTCLQVQQLVTGRNRWRR
jgi:hypothetical protein